MRKREAATPPTEEPKTTNVPEPPKSVEDISRKLAEELGQVDKPEEPYEFASAQRKASMKPLRPDLERIVETVWVTDIHEEWIRLKATLQVGEKRSDHGVLHKGLDEARKNSYDAHRLWITAKKEMERWESENELIFAAMWEKAARALQIEKEAGSRNKTITNEDVRARCIVLFPSEYAAQERKRREVKMTVENLQQLSKDCSEKCSDLGTMLSKLRNT